MFQVSTNLPSAINERLALVHLHVLVLHTLCRTWQRDQVMTSDMSELFVENTLSDSDGSWKQTSLTPRSRKHCSVIQQTQHEEHWGWNITQRSSDWCYCSVSQNCIRSGFSMVSFMIQCTPNPSDIFIIWAANEVILSSSTFGGEDLVMGIAEPYRASHSKQPQLNQNHLSPGTTINYLNATHN